MKAQVTFTPNEAKYLIARGIASLDRVRRAYESGILALHPSSSTYFITKALTGSFFEGTGVWVTGCVLPRGLCISKSYGASDGAGKESLKDPKQYSHTMVYIKGVPTAGVTIDELSKMMQPNDIYIKGVNALDVDGNVGVILGSQSEGSIGIMTRCAREKHYEIIAPVGYEKLIPGKVTDAAEMTKGVKDYAMGVKCALVPIQATAFTEVDALRTLTGVEARVYSCGGLQGAEGSVSIALSGEDEQIARTIELCESVKGVEVPPIPTENCAECKTATCFLSGKNALWV